MAITTDQLEAALTKMGFQRRDQTTKKRLFVHSSSGELVYLNCDPGRSVPGLVIHPRHDRLRHTLSMLPGVSSSAERYHSSNMRKFPTRVNRGARAIPYGIPFSFDSDHSVEVFLTKLLASYTSAESGHPAPVFKAGAEYTRSDIQRQLGLRDSGGGAWYTGLVRQGDDHFIFCGVGTGGRTGHDYRNRFIGPDLLWHGKTDSLLRHDSIQALLGDTARVHVFYRDDDRAAFTYAGRGRALHVKETSPVEILWSFRGDDGAHPEFLPDEVEPSEVIVEGAKRQITVNVYERDPAARSRCIRRWGTACSVCGFDFQLAYGMLGEGYIHVHHVRPLSEIGEEYTLNPETDLRPVCPNCHAMIHRKHPALSIAALRLQMGTASANNTLRVDASNSGSPVMDDTA